VTEQQRDHGKDPFFMSVAYIAAHWPMHALPEDIAKYEGVYDRGYAPIRQERFAHMKELGLVDPPWKLSPVSGDWDKVPNKEWEDRCREIYAAMVDRMDQFIGRLVDALKGSGQLDNTLILFLQNNGGCAEATGRSPDKERPEQPTLPPIAADALRQDVIPKQTREGRPVLSGRLVMPGPPDPFIAYGQAWAIVSNRIQAPGARRRDLDAAHRALAGGPLAPRGARTTGRPPDRPEGHRGRSRGREGGRPGRRQSASRARRQAARPSDADLLGARGQQGDPRRQVEARVQAQRRVGAL